MVNGYTTYIGKRLFVAVGVTVFGTVAQIESSLNILEVKYTPRYDMGKSRLNAERARHGIDLRGELC